MPYEPVVLNTIAIATYNDGTTFPIVKINYPFILENDGETLSVMSRNAAAIPPYDAYPTDLDLNMWLLFLHGPYGFCSWKQLAWHSGNSVIFGIGRNSEFWHVNNRGETVVDWSIMPVGDCDLPSYGFVKLFERDSIEPIVAEELNTKFSFGNELWKIPNKDIMRAIGDVLTTPPSFGVLGNLLTVPQTGAKTVTQKTLSSVLEYRGNPEQVVRIAEELRKSSYGLGKIGELWVGEKIFPARFNSLKGHTRCRQVLLSRPTPKWATSSDKFFDDRVVFWRRPISEQLLRFYSDPAENSQGVVMVPSSVEIGDSFNRWPLVTRVDSSVRSAFLHTNTKSKTGELATSPFGDAVVDQVPASVGTATQMYTAFGDHEVGVLSCNIKLVLLNTFMELKYYAPLQAGKTPWYDSYEDFQNDVRPLSKGMSVLPEFRISPLVERGVSPADLTDLELVGTSPPSAFSWDSLSDVFAEQNVVSSELLTVKEFSERTAGQSRRRAIRFEFDAIKKIHPYSGFFPAERALQIGNLLYKSYFEGVYGVSGSGATQQVVKTDKQWQAFLYHFAAPGLIYNSIKSAVGVGLPIFSSSSSSLSSPVYAYHNDGNFIPKCIMSNPKYYLPFDALFNVTKYVVPVQDESLSAIQKDWGRLMFAPYLWELFPGDSYFHDLNCFLRSGQFRPLFDLANHNFFAESASLFLKDGLSAFFSKPESQFKAMVGGSVYYMDVVLRNKNCVICEGASDQTPTDEADYFQEFSGVPAGDDGTFAGTFIDNIHYVSVRIKTEGKPDVFDYSINGGAYSGGINITPGSAQALGTTGATITFVGDDNHTVGDTWYYYSPGHLMLSQRGQVFGFPVSLSSSLPQETTSDVQELVRELDIRDPAYGPFSPPYFYGPAVARISFDPQEADPSLQDGQSRKFTLDEILKHAEIRTFAKTNTGGQIRSGANTYYAYPGANTYYAYPGADEELNAQNGFFHEFDWKTAMYHHVSDVYSESGAVTNVLGSTILQNGFMSIAQSVDLFGKKLVTSVGFDGGARTPTFLGVQKSLGAEKEYSWCINTKWESPVLQFNKHSTSTLDNMGSVAQEWPGRSRGMWMDYGEEPGGEDGLFLEIRESFPERKVQGRAAKSFYKNTNPEELKGSNVAMESVMLEEIYDLYDEVGGAYVPKKSVESLIDVCGFSVAEKRVGEVRESAEVSEAVVVLPFYRENNEVRFFEIDREVLKGQIENKQQFGYAHKTSYGDELKNTSITDLVEKLDRYVFPPWLDFLQNDVVPLVMYVCEFGTTLEKSDLLDIWQNFASDKFYDSESEKKIIEHGWDKYELFHGTDLPENTQFAVFKVKKRAKWNYNSVKPNYNPDEEFAFSLLNDQGVWESRRVDYNFNWPYDFFSLVEFGKVSCFFEFVGE